MGRLSKKSKYDCFGGMARGELSLLEIHFWCQSLADVRNSYTDYGFMVSLPGAFLKLVQLNIFKRPTFFIISKCMVRRPWKWPLGYSIFMPASALPYNPSVARKTVQSSVLQWTFATFTDCCAVDTVANVLVGLAGVDRFISRALCRSCSRWGIAVDTIGTCPLSLSLHVPIPPQE